MPSVKDGLDLIEQFISLGKELAKLPALVLPQYQPAAADLFEICKKILTANENLARWLHRFRYFDFSDPDARSKFLAAVQEYRSLRTGPAFQQLKFSCGDISQVYYRNISSKLGGWFSSSHKLEEAEGVFAKLTDADLEMVDFLQEHILKKLDGYLGETDTVIDIGNMENAEKLRLELKLDTGEVVQYLEKFSNELSDLVLEFGKIARVPLTL
jgi:hypothetical protein